MPVSAVPNVDPGLAPEIEALRARFPETQDLYREVCTLLFFRHGITPTANKLYQLVRKGSMSAPAEALARFWENLREKSRIRIEHPDLPPELGQAAGELLGTLWQRAQGEAQSRYEAARQELEQTSAQAEKQAQEAHGRAETAALALFQLQSEFSTNLTRMQELEHALAKQQGEASALERQVASAVQQRREMQEALGAARKDFEAQVEQQRALARAAEERHLEALQRLRLEHERERTGAARLQEELDSARRQLGLREAQHGVQMQRAQEEIAALRQQLGAAEGSLSETRSARDQLRRQLEQVLDRGKSAGPGRQGRFRPRSRSL
jgi:hypothetical protein